MKKSVWLWSLVGFAVVSIGGTLLHFLYDLTGGAIWAALFSGVNESTFEHMKLLFWPTFIFAVIQSFFFRDTENFWCVKLRGTLIGLLLIPLLFYTYNGVIGKSPDFVNIGIFFVSSAVAFIYEAKKLLRGGVKCKNPTHAIFALCLIAFFFILFTFHAPKIDIFKDPITQTYGI